jgi:broad specificity phosphatase PhoE
MSPALFSTPQQKDPCEESSTSRAPYKPWQVYPMEHHDELKAIHGHGKVKVVHIVRHAEGTHNVEQNYKCLSNLDARLTDKGQQQCTDLAERIQATLLVPTEDICVWTSPMTRCVETALFSFPFLAENPDIPFLAHEAWRETVNFNCDRRRSLAESRDEFPRIDFSWIVENHDPIWDSYRKRVPDDWDKPLESFELHVVTERALEGFRSLQQRPESNFIVCSHSAFLRCILNWGQSGGVPKLPPQELDEREHPATNHKLFEYMNGNVDPSSSDFEEYMRSDYENCELRSFCLLVQDETTDLDN